MTGQRPEDEIGRLIWEFFHARLRVLPRAVEVRATGDFWVVRVKGFLAPAEAAMTGDARDLEPIERYYRLVFRQVVPLLQAGIRRAAGRPILDVESILSLSSDECLLVLALGPAEEPDGRPSAAPAAPPEGRCRRGHRPRGPSQGPIPKQLEHDRST